MPLIALNALIVKLPTLQEEFALTYIFVSHSLPVVTRIARAYRGNARRQISGGGPAEAILRRPEQPYTRELLAAVPALPA